MEPIEQERGRISRRDMSFAFLLPIVLLAPFANRAFNIDEPMFVWVAQQIAHNPFDFFGGYVERSSGPEPMYLYNQNPPGFSYVLALFGVVGGWSEPVLRLASLLTAGLCALGTYLVAARFSTRPLFATVAMVLTPGFLVSGATVMTDVALVACYVWAMWFGIRGVDTRKASWLAAAVATISAGALMKYYGVTVAPLIVVYALAKRTKPGPWLVAFLIPGVVLAAFWWWSWRLYGVNLLTVAAEVAQDASVRSGDAASYREWVTLMFVGGCFAPMALYAPGFMRPIAIAGLTALAVGLVTPAIDGYSLLQLMLGTPTPYGLNMRVHLGVMSLAGAILVWLSARDLVRQRDVERVVLALWIFGALIFAIYVNHLINARTLLPVAPALGMLVARNLSPEAFGAKGMRAIRFAPLAAGLVLSIWVLLGDYAVAQSGRASARQAAARAEADGVSLYYAGLWGFQYYIQIDGARVFSVEDGGWGGEFRVRMQQGDLVAISSDGREQWRRPPAGFEEVSILGVPNRFAVATYHPADEAGFYSHLAGIVPYKFGLASREEYGLYRWDGPSYVPAPDASP